MASFNGFSFGDFEVPPLDIPDFSATPATQYPDLETDSECSDIGSSDETEDEPHLVTTAIRNSHLEPGDQQNQVDNHKNQSDLQEQADEGKQSLKDPYEQHAVPTAPDKDVLALPAHTAAQVAMKQPLPSTTTATQAVNPSLQEAAQISVTTDGWTYRNVTISRLQTAQEVRDAIRGSLGFDSHAHLLIYLTTTDRVTRDESLVDGALFEEVLRTHDLTKSKFLVLQSAHQENSRIRQRWADFPLAASSSVSPAKSQSPQSQEHHGMLSMRGKLRIDTSVEINAAGHAAVGPTSRDVRLQAPSHYIPPTTSNLVPKVQTMPHSQIMEIQPRRALSNRYKPPRTGSPPSMDSQVTSSQDPDDSHLRQSRREQSQTEQVKIRDGSRARHIPVDFVSGELCDYCQTCGHRRFHCNVCKFVFCDPCWELQFPHRAKQTAAGALPHERTNPHIAKKIGNVLSPQLKEEQREQQHIDDIDTTWFGVVREAHERPLLQDYGRYATLVASVKELRLGSISSLSASSDCGEALYPSLVSFVGQTGAGKSSLIKLLIDLKSDEDEPFETPVVGAAGRDVATSEDVHLYLDPDSSESQAPLLFADCEGLEGGERDPVGAKLKRKMASLQKNAPGDRRKPTSERELVWADTPKKQSRDFAVAHLYPRLLYTFSDVIVFVLKNPRVVESVLERLVDWAAAALEKSSNQPVLPHAIIAFNASENDIPEELWDVEHATEALMESLSRTVYQNATFKKYAQFWRERDRQIESVQELVLSYYSSLRVVRIPTTGRPMLIREQVEKLSSSIRWASSEARKLKLESRMLLDADELQPYLQNAFDHFADKLDTPFDFVQASFTNSPIPHNFGGNILKLALQILERWEDVAKASTIFEELSYLVASCILLDATRQRILGRPEQIFPEYLEHLDNALENFCDRHWPCEYVDPKRQGGRCVNVRSGHGAKGHQSKTGKLLAAGEYVSSFTFSGNKQKFQNDTYEKLLTLTARVSAKETLGISKEQAVAEVHRELVMPPFFEHASRGDVRTFVSHTVCFSCLIQPPEHALPCGHIICTSCLKTHGKMHLDHYAEISACPMERSEKRFRSTWKVSLKPASCGVRVLTLDGGGVRGIVELEILRQLEKELGDLISIQSFFDLIVGTSTGGIVALGLTARNWTVQECIEKFKSLCHKAFKLRRGMNVPGLGWLVSNYNHSRYETQPLQEALLEAFGEDQYLFGGQRAETGTIGAKVAVTATSSAGTAIVLANYNRLSSEKLPYQFYRPEKQIGELKTWEAARATSAAPTYFKALCHESSKQTFWDGGVYNNNPINIAERERKLIWPILAEQEPDVVVSIGTLFCRKIKNERTTKWVASPKGIVAHFKFLAKMAHDHMHTSLDSQRTWEEFISVRGPAGQDKGRYIRLNPELEVQPPKMDEVDQLENLEDIARFRMGGDYKLQTLARQLIATSFYFETVGDVREDSAGELFEVDGFFHCRFTERADIEGLGKLIRRFATAGHMPYFNITGTTNNTILEQEVIIDDRTLNRMTTSRGLVPPFRMREVTVRGTNKAAKTSISLCFTNGTLFPLSQFPRSLHADPSDLNLPGRPGLKAMGSIRWASRSGSQRQRRFDWKPPNLPTPIEKDDVLSRYSDVSHLLGSATSLSSLTTAVHELGSSPGAFDEAMSPWGTTKISPPKFEQLKPAPIHELPAIEVIHELPPGETIHELPDNQARTTAPKFWMADEDWADTEPRSSGSMYMSLTCGDVLQVLEMPSEGLNGSVWRVLRPSDGREGWVPSYCLRPLEPVIPRRQQFDASPIDGVFW